MSKGTKSKGDIIQPNARLKEKKSDALPRYTNVHTFFLLSGKLVREIYIPTKSESRPSFLYAAGYCAKQETFILIASCLFGNFED